MQINSPLTAVILTLFIAAGCQPRPAGQLMDHCVQSLAVEAEIADVLQRHVQAHLNADPIGAADMYTDDVRIMYNTIEINSKNTMVNAYQEAYKGGTYTEVAYLDDETLVCGDAAHSVGHNLNTMESKADGTRRTERQQYMLLWRQQSDGSWKMARGAAMTIPEDQ